MEKKNDKNQASYECAAYQYMSEEWARTQDVFEGVRRMRTSNQYLDRFEKEEDADYSKRKNRTEFYNVFRANASGIVGMILSNNVMPNDVPKPLAELFTDINLLGDDVAMFLRETLTNAVRDGHSFIFIDAPPPVEVPEGTTPTLADVADRRAWWVNYKANQAHNWQFEQINGKTVLSQVTFKECTKEPDGLYGEKDVIRERVLRRGSYSLYRHPDKTNEAEKSLTDLIPEIEDAPFGIDEIPLAVLYARKVAPMESTPPLAELLDANLTHYNSQSILREVLKYVVPMVIIKMDSFDDHSKFNEITVAANRALKIWGEHADVKYLELQGKSVPELRQDIQDIEARMAKMGLEKFAPIDEINKTAYEVGSDNRQQMSEISVIAKNLETAFEQAIYFTAELMNSIKTKDTISLTDAEKSSLKLNIDYDSLVLSPQEWAIASSLVDKKQLSLQTFLEWLQTMTNMPKGFSPEEELKRLAAEKQSMEQRDTLDKEDVQQTKQAGAVNE